MKHAALLLALGVLALLAIFGFRGHRAPQPKVSQDRTPVLVELFTSEGCSSCPSADALLARISQSQPYAGRLVIPIEEHVDYWNNLGWRDPFSSAGFSARQQAYAQRFSLDGPYTPQAVVNGSAEFVGSDEGALQSAVDRSVSVAPISVSVSQMQKNRWDVKVGVPSGKQATSVFVALVEDGLQSQVARGENAGRRLEHGSVVRVLQKIGVARAGQVFNGEESIPLAPEWKVGGLKVVAFAQVGETGPIVAIGQK